MVALNEKLHHKTQRHDAIAIATVDPRNASYHGTRWNKPIPKYASINLCNPRNLWMVTIFRD